MRRAAETSDGFRLRGREVTRLESFSDAVFAFALTLLVVSLEAPKTYAELVGTMRGMVAFAVCFAILAMIWNHHYVFCRRFGLDDGFVRFLTCVLLFIVLAYVYPLKFLFNLFINGMLLGGARGQLTLEQGRNFFVIYGLGFAAIYLALTLLYWHAYQRRAEFELNDREMLDTRWEIYGLLCQVGVGVLSATLAVSLPAHLIDWAGFVYFSLFIVMTIHGSAHGRLRRKLAASSQIA